MNAEQFLSYKTALFAWIVSYGPKLIGAILLWVIGAWLINRLSRIVERTMKHHLYDVSLQAFALNILTIGLKILLLFSVAGMIGIQTTSFLAIIGALGLAMGLALQGSLSNFAGGVLILIFKPFKIGDLIEAQGQIGIVKSIQIFSSVLETPSNRSIIIPNGILSNGTIVNLSCMGPVYFELKLELDDSNKFKDVKTQLMEELMQTQGILHKPAPSVSISEFSPQFTILINGFSESIHHPLAFNTIKERIKELMENKILLSPMSRSYVTTLNEN